MRPEHRLLHGPALAAVLKLLEQGPSSMHELVEQLRPACPEALALGEGSLLALLYCLEGHLLVVGSWREAVGQRRRVYALTDRGRRRLVEETRQWRSLAVLFASADEPSNSQAHVGGAKR